jgi:AmmeMemoRadiSam system protein B
MTRTGGIRWPAVAGSFYPDDPADLAELVDGLLAAAGDLPGVRADRHEGRRAPTGILAPHAGLAYSGVVAAAGWATIADGPDGHDRPPLTVVLLGTNHVAPWLRGVAVWPTGTWDTPTAVSEIDEDLTEAILDLGAPFAADPEAHQGEHSIEVQLPLLGAVAPSARIVPLAIGTGTGEAAIEAGRRLGRLLAARRAEGSRIVLAISSDMAHYPVAEVCEQVTRGHLPALLRVDAAALAAREHALREEAPRGVACGMCGIEPAVLGLAALHAMGAETGTMLAAATSADAGGPRQRTVGYLAVRFDP